MGNCIANSKTKQYHHQNKEDVSRFTPEVIEKLPKLSFEGWLSNIKIKVAHKNIISLKFVIDHILDVDLAKKTKLENQPEINWKMMEEFEFSLNDYQIRTNYLMIFAFDENYNQITTQKINLFHIITGPYHHDYGFEYKGKTIRLLFDMKISQLLHVNVSPQMVSVQLNTFLPGEEFNYSFKVLKCDTSTHFSSQPSQTILSASFLEKDQFKIMTKQDQCPSPTKMRKTQGNKLIKVQKKTTLKWIESQHAQMSAFNVKLKVSQILKCSVRFALWRITAGENDEQCILFADNYLSFNNLFLKEPRFEKQTEQRYGQFKSELWSHGKVVGESQINLKISNPKFYKQLMACARTQDGIISMTSLFKNYGSDKSSKNQLINKICQLSTRIINKNIELNQMEISSAFGKVRKTKEEMSKLFSQLHSILKQSHDESRSLSTVEEKYKLIEEQFAILGVCEKLYIFIEDDDITFSEESWGIIVLLLSRGEFLLKNIGIYHQANSIKNQSLQSKKKLVALKYQEQIFKVLLLALKFSSFDSRKHAKLYTDKFKAICYMRVTVFRQKLLSVLSQKQNLENAEYNRYSGCYEDDLSTQSQEVFVNHLDWETYFYRPLKQNQCSQKLIKTLKQKLKDHDWFKLILHKEDQLFCAIGNVIVWIDSLKRQCQIQSWYYFPGYNKLISSFFKEMEKVPLQNYTRSLETASLQILCNDKLINPLLKVIFDKTNSNQNSAVLKTLDLVDGYFSYLTIHQQSLPMNFSYISFFKGLKIILENTSDYSCVAKTLLLIYNFYDKFGMQFKRIITKYMLGKIFFKMFLHWSVSVRQIFHHIIVLRIDPQVHTLSQNSIGIQVNIMFQKALQSVQTQFQLAKGRKKDLIVSRYQKDLFKIMKRKLNQLKLKKEKKSGLLNPQIPEEIKEGRRQRKYSMCVQSLNYNIRSQNQNVFNNINPEVQQSKKIQQQMQEMKEISLFIRKSTGNKLDGKKREQGQESLFSQTSTSIKRISKTRIQCFFGKDDFDFKPADKNELKYIQISNNRFKQIKSQVNCIFKQTGKLPVVPLTICGTFDDKDFKPLTYSALK